MRVTRRTRPSQVGFAASVGRRRLLQTFDSPPTAARSEPLSTDGLRMVIRLEYFQPDPAIFADRDDIRRQPTSAPSSSARGR
jgi:hypothetical protein